MSNFIVCPLFGLLIKPPVWYHRFIRRVKIPNDIEHKCAYWLGPKTGGGHGTMSIDNKTNYCHQLALTLSGQTLKQSDRVLHSCDNASCVNPNHLRIGTQQENFADAKERNIHLKRHLITAPYKMCKLSDKNVEEIKRLYAEGNSTVRGLAFKFNCGKSQISNIINNKSRTVSIAEAFNKAASL